MYLFVKDLKIRGFARNSRIASLGNGLVTIDGQICKNPYPGSDVKIIPDQKIGWMYGDGPSPQMKDGLVYPDDVPTLPSLEIKLAQIDYETGELITQKCHMKAGVSESIGVLRDQMVQWGNALGLDFTEDFTRLNGIAIAAIEDGVAKKAKL